MKRIFAIILSTLLVTTTFGQGIVGKWFGNLKIQGMELPIVFHIDNDTVQQKLVSTMDSPKQGAFGIEVETITFLNGELNIALPKLMISYKGNQTHTDTISGLFMQSSLQIQLPLVRQKEEMATLKRPQDPSLPLPYSLEDIVFVNKKANISLAGTLTYPKGRGKHPAVVLISGSGPQNRDEELMGHRPFLVLSDYLTRKGIAVLRFDDRGFGKSEGDFSTATTFDFATDVEAAVEYLLSRKEIDKKRIGLVGHSEGGIIAPIVANGMKQVGFIVLMAGTGIPGSELLLEQQELIGRAMGLSEEYLNLNRTMNELLYGIINSTTDVEQLVREVSAFTSRYIDENPEIIAQQQISKEEILGAVVQQYSSPWMVNFIKYNPASALEKVKCHVLAINGEKDLQVPAELNLEAIRAALEKGGNRNYTIKKYPDLNHLFQECSSGLPQEYALIEQTISPQVLEDIANWINQIK